MCACICVSVVGGDLRNCQIPRALPSWIHWCSYGGIELVIAGWVPDKKVGWLPSPFLACALLPCDTFCQVMMQQEVLTRYSP
jgi:hypothetical protein